MDVLVYFAIVTIVAILGTDVVIRAEACVMDIPSSFQKKCTPLNVTNGDACYTVVQNNLLANVSCHDMYTIDEQTKFNCTGSGIVYSWTPSAAASCSLRVTPTLTPYTSMSKTEMNTVTSGFQTESSVFMSSSTSRMLSTISSSITVTSAPAASHDVEDSDIKPVYIAAPVTVLFIAFLLGIWILWWRRRTPKPAALFERREPGSLITNQVYAANGIDRNCSLMNVRQSRMHEYAEIHLDIMNSDETVGDNYQTIDILPEDKADVKKSYDTFKLSETEFSDTNYSHIGLNNTQNNNHTDNTYSHTQLENVTQKPKITVNGDDTYNKLHSATLHERKCQDSEISDTEYSHAHAGLHDSEIEADNYSHLNTNMRTQGESTVMTKRQCEDEKKNQKSNTCQLSDKALPLNTDYEFVKDFDNLQRSSEAPEYAKVTKEKPQNTGKGYETAVGTIHNYLILEPEQNQAPTAALFNVVEEEPVVEDEPAANGGKHETETDHKYFTLEKLNT